MIDHPDPHRVRLPLQRTRRSIAHGLLAVAMLGACNTLDTTDPNAGRFVTTPRDLSASPAFVQISAGFFHTCALTATGSAYCWGGNQYNQLGTKALLPACDLGGCALLPVTSGDARAYRVIAAGATHTCAIGIDNRTYCWGATTVNAAPILGDGATVSSAVPILVQTDSVYTTITLGTAHACGLTAGGTAWCWGRNDVGQLGDNSVVNRGTPVAVSGARRFTALSAGADFTCGLTTDRAIYCWGSNQWGQLGTGDVTFNVPGRVTLVPTAIAGTQAWTSIAAGGAHACAVAADQRVYCWGRNDNLAQLGDSTGVTHRGTPGPIASALTFQRVAAGAGHTCAITATGDAWCWGGNTFGTVGDGRTRNSGEPVPMKVVTGTWAQLALGGSHSCGIATSGSTWCWGDARYGALGIR